MSSIAIVSHIYIDFVSFFFLTFVGMQLGPDLFKAQVAFSNTSSIYFRIPISLSLGLLTYVGASMG
jgi:MATE family multidrug resistance protein